MEKEILFRMWNNVKHNPQASRMFYDIDEVMTCLKQQILFNTHDDSVIGYNHIGEGNVFMQYTGLKDKNGVRIFEGDILQICNGSINGHDWMMKDRVVSYNGVGLHNIPTWSFDSTHWFEVIGNIYETVNKDF